MTIPRIASVVALSAVAVTAAVLPAGAAQRPVPQTRTICVSSVWIERAPAYKPQGLARRHDPFRVDRYVHTPHKGIWAHGTHLNGDRHSGWVKASALCA
jgi:hypothetical protein